MAKFLKRTIKRKKGLRFQADAVEIEDLDSPIALCRPNDGIGYLCEVTKFTRKEVQLMYRTFKQDCPSGRVCEETFCIIYSKFFPHGDATKYAGYVFRAFDGRNTGCLTFDEFMLGLSTLTRGSTRDKLRWAFDLYDINKDGVITKEELQEIVTSVHRLLGRSISPACTSVSSEQIMELHATRIFQKLDGNGDGVVTLEEFLEACLQDETIPHSLSFLDTVF